MWVDEGQKVGRRLSFMVSGAIEEEEDEEEKDDEEDEEEEDYTSLRRGHSNL
jgi:hypothetical protein